MTQENTVQDIFGLTIEETQLLYSIEYQICIKSLADAKKKRIEATEWLAEWEKGINNVLKLMTPKDEGTYKVLDNYEAMNLARRLKSTTKLKASLYVIILEACLFKPYYPIFVTDSNDEKIQKQYEKKNKDIGEITFDEKVGIEVCKEFCKYMDLDEKVVETFIKSYNKAIDSITKFWTKVLIGTGLGILVFAIAAAVWATTIGAALVAGTGLTGAAASSAGLALLGGGAIAVGGFGMAGGIAVVVGGGAVLGGVMGGSTAMLFMASPDIALSQAAKLEVVLKEIILGQMKDIKLAQEILKKQGECIIELRKKLQAEELKNKKNEEAIKNLKKAIEYLEEAFKDNKKFVKVN